MTFSDLDESGRIEASETTGSSEILQENHYYPFGMAMDGPWKRIAFEPENRYLYNGKELNEDFGLDWLDYGARSYDASIGRWNAVDPLAGTYSPLSTYCYVANNPIKFLDPDGKKISPSITRNDDGDITGVNIHVVGKIIDNTKGGLNERQLERRRKRI